MACYSQQHDDGTINFPKKSRRKGMPPSLLPPTLSAGVEMVLMMPVVGRLPFSFHQVLDLAAPKHTCHGKFFGEV